MKRYAEEPEPGIRSTVEGDFDPFESIVTKALYHKGLDCQGFEVERVRLRLLDLIANRFIRAYRFRTLPGYAVTVKTRCFLISTRGRGHVKRRLR